MIIGWQPPNKLKIKNVIDFKLDGLKLIEFENFIDNRGSFAEIWTEKLNDLIGNPKFVQMNESICKKLSIRGLHFQWSPFVGKLLRVLDGSVHDYVVDIRLSSPTLGKANIIELNTRRNEWFWIPPGFAHAVFTLNDSRFQYFCSGIYNKETEGAIHPFSKDIDYSLCANSLTDLQNSLTISDKDSKALQLEDWLNTKEANNFVYGEC